MDQQRQFRGVWFPRELWFDKTLSWQEKAFLVEIDSLEDEKKGCWASNKHFNDLFNISSGRTAQIISSLQDKGYIRVEYEREGKEIISRNIFLNRPPYPEGYLENLKGVFRNTKGGYLEKLKESNTYISNTKENIYIVEQVVSYLNEKINANYKTTTRKTKDLIKARLNEGFDLDDFKKVIDNMSREWLKDSKMKVYLRPETLFGTKFESYLNRNNKSKADELTIVPTKKRELTEDEKRILNDINKRVEEYTSIH